jgi:HSP20 family molecular chaperone IbpA|tara:strand:- start:1997 stop:2422 length:426 start_codon:yes stop_codon:yes gene_type:complete
MTRNLLFQERLLPTDLLFRNLFETDSLFKSHIDSKPNYPVDIYTTEEGLIFDIAVVGLDKNHIKIEIDSNMLKILHEKDAEIDSDNKDYIHKGIARRAFNLGWKVSPKYNLKKIDAKMENGLLSILVPIEPDAKPVEIKIN